MTEVDDGAEGEARKLKARLRRETEESDYKWLMSTARGRRIVWRMLEQSKVYQLSFSTDAMAMAFNEGNKNFGLQLLATISALAPAEYLEMIKEAKNDPVD